MVQNRSFFLFTLFMSMFFTKVYAYDFVVDGIYYSFVSNSNSAMVTFGDNKYKGTIVIPSTVSYNGRTLDVTYIGKETFKGCTELTSISIPNSIEYISNSAFEGCSSLTSMVIPGSVKDIGINVFEGCERLKTIVFEDGEEILSTSDISFKPYEIRSTYFPKYVYFGRNSMAGWNINISYFTRLAINSQNVEVLSFGPKVSKVLPYEFENLKVVYCMNEDPALYPSESNYNDNFSSNAYANAILYVPIGTKEKYAKAEIWKNFFNIQEMDVNEMWHGNGEPSIDNTSSKRCDKPTISYSKGKLTFSSNTPDVICHSTITDSDIKSYNANEIQLGVTYNISVYASRAGYKDSETATATLCWIDVDPKTEGITNGVASVRANAVLIQSDGGMFSISGADEGTPISIYNAAGQMVGSSKAAAETTHIGTSLRNGEIGIVKIGERALKVLMKY